MNDVTFIIPIVSKNIDTHILAYNVNRMKEVSEDIIAVSQYDLTLPEELGIYFLTFDITDKHTLIEQVLPFVEKEYIWVNDYNVTFDFKKSYEGVSRQDFYNPCKNKYFLDKPQSKNVMNGDDPEELEIEADNTFGKFSYIANADKLKEYYTKFSYAMFTKGLAFFKLDRYVDTPLIDGYILSDKIEAKVIIREEPESDIEVNAIERETEESNIGVGEIKRKKPKVKSDIKHKPKVKSDIKYKPKTQKTQKTQPKLKKSKGVTSRRNIKASQRKFGPVQEQNIPSGIDSGEYPIVHVTNFPPHASGELKKRTDLALSSIMSNQIDGVKLLNCGTTPMELDGWEFTTLERDSKTELDNNKDVPFLKDLLDEAVKHCHPNGYILYTNSDCGISDSIYDDLMEFNGTVKEYQRKDILNDPQTLEELYNNPYEVFYIGVDGVAFNAKYYLEIRDELPDVVIGDPYWDPAISGILKNMTKVVQESFDLYHPKHAQVWSVDDLKPAGMHNYTIYNDALTYGQSDLDSIQEVTDTALVIVNYGKDPLRLNASEVAFKKLVEQECNFKIYWVECLYEGTTSNYSDFIINHPRLEHVLIQGTDKNKDLWQKESLMNIGAKVVKEDNIIFVDNDIWSKDPKWLKKIRDKLIQHERKVVHGFFVSQDTEDPRLNYQSLGSVNMFDAETDLDVNPGLCWGITKRFFDSMAGINPFFVDGGGDSGFVCEYLNTPEKTYDSYLFRFDWYQKIYRNMGVKGMLDCVDSDIIHQNHGKFASRNYNTIRYAIDELKDDIQKFCRKDKQGLLEWVDPECAERRIMKRRPEMFDNEIMKEIVKSEYK